MEQPQQAPGWRRLALTAALVIGLWVAAEVSGAREWLTQARIRELVATAGPWGFLVYVALFAAGNLLQLPGVLFVMAARVAYGPVAGFALAYVGGLIAVTTSFAVIRQTGGQQLRRIKSPRIRRVLSRLETAPRRTVAVLRLLMWVSPPLNYALALSPIRFRDYVCGSAVGLILPIAVLTAMANSLLQMIGTP